MTVAAFYDLIQGHVAQPSIFSSINQRQLSKTAIFAAQINKTSLLYLVILFSHPVSSARYPVALEAIPQAT